MSKAKKKYGPDIYKRNEHGLLENVNYTFNDDGSVDWRAMVKPEFLYPNKDWFVRRNKPLPDSIEGLEDKQLLIMLGGIKELAKLRGYTSIDFDVRSNLSPDGSTLIIPKNVVAELKFPDTDIKGRIR